jgi:hypothetical protein
MASGKAQHYNAHKRYLLELELKHVLCMSAEELEEAEQREELVGACSDSEEGEEGGEDSDEEEEGEGGSEGGSSSDGEHVHFDGDDMDEESLAIAREMRDDQRGFADPEGEGEGGLDSAELAAELLLHAPDESELIEGGAVVSLIAIPAPWEPWDSQECVSRDLPPPSGQRSGSDSDDLELDVRDGLSALRPPMNRSEGSCIMHGNAITHEDSG